MVTIKDVAKKANVSIATVSCVINEKDTVKLETKEKVLAAINELNYVPSFAGRMLKIKETKIIGSYVSDLQGHFYGEVLNGLKSYVVSQGYEFVVMSGSKQHKLIKQNIFDGIIVLDSYFKTNDLIKYADLNLKIVLMDREITHKNINCITLNNEKGVHLCMDHLKSLGYKSVICLTGPSNSYDSTARINAVLTYASNNDFSLEMAQGNFDEQSGYDFGKKFENNFKEKKAIFTFNDEMFLGIYNYFKENNKSLENYMDVVSFDNIPVLKYLNFKMASVSYSKFDWGFCAGETLLKSFDESINIKHKKIDLELVKY